MFTIILLITKNTLKSLGSLNVLNTIKLHLTLFYNFAECIILVNLFRVDNNFKHFFFLEHEIYVSQKINT